MISHILYVLTLH
jgi:hypothetical protein